MTAPDAGSVEECVRTGRVRCAPHEVGGLHTPEGLRLRIFVHEALRYDHKPLYAAIVDLARREGLAGATVFRGLEGYGLHRHLHTSRLVDLSDDLPIIVEIVDTSEAIRRFLPLLDQVIPHGTATLSPVHIVKYSPGQRT